MNPNSPAPHIAMGVMPPQVREAIDKMTGGAAPENVVAQIKDQTTQIDRRPLYIFDLDGTLSIGEHRKHLVKKPDDWDEKANGKWKADWEAFYDASVDDEPNLGVVAMMMNLASVGVEIRIWSGRSERVKSATALWLASCTKVDAKIMKEALRMRPVNDFTPVAELKEQWLKEMPIQDRMRLFGVFEDASKVVDMWRRNGVLCFALPDSQL